MLKVLAITIGILSFLVLTGPEASAHVVHFRPYHQHTVTPGKYVVRRPWHLGQHLGRAWRISNGLPVRPLYYEVDVR